MEQQLVRLQSMISWSRGIELPILIHFGVRKEALFVVEVGIRSLRCSSDELEVNDAKLSASCHGHISSNPHADYHAASGVRK